ncbi:hypothetical protein ACLESD_17455 [Pyxidicoccus sp. 3LFB2]
MLATDMAAPLPLELARRLPGTARAHFYDVVRCAMTAARVRQLLPLAEVLDRAFGGTVLADYTRRVAARDFSRRGPLAGEYARLLRRNHANPAAFIQKLRASGEEDLLLGALLLSPTVPRERVEVETLASHWKDPWVGVLAQEELARLESLAGQPWQAGQRLRDALRMCREQELGLRCLDLQRRMSHMATSANRLAEAEELARSSWREARLWASGARRASPCARSARLPATSSAWRPRGPTWTSSCSEALATAMRATTCTATGPRWR